VALKKALVLLGCTI